MKLFSAWYCPFAQRTWTALLYKGAEFEYVEIDPYDKTPEWMRVSRGTGQVPVLVDENLPRSSIAVPDSIRTLEYIDLRLCDEARALFPTSAAERADVNFWIDFQRRMIIPAFYRFLKSQAGSAAECEARGALENGIDQISQNMAHDGAYFSGRQISAVDIALAPFALRIELLLSRYKQYALPGQTVSGKRYYQWWEAMRTFPPFTATCTAPDYEKRLTEFYLPYSKGGGQDMTAP